MNRTRALWIFVLSFSAAAFLLAATTSGQQREVCCPKYDVVGEQMVHAVIEKVEVRFGQAEQAGVHLLARGKDGLYDVQVGPKSYLKKLRVTFEEGQAIIVLGAPVIGLGRVDPETPLAFVPRTIQRGDEVIELRTEDGFPLWRRGRPT